MEKGITYVGLDVHKRGIAISVRWPGGQEPERRTIANEPRAVGRRSAAPTRQDLVATSYSEDSWRRGSTARSSPLR